MTIHLSIDGVCAEEVLSQLSVLSAALGGKSAVVIDRQEAPRPPVEPTHPAEPQPEPATKPTRARKPKAEPPIPAGPAPFSVPGKDVEAAQPVAEAVQDAPAAPAPEPKTEAPVEAAAIPSQEDARAALVALAKAKDMTVAGGLVAKFGVAKVSELPADKRAAFIAEAQQLAA